MRKIRWGVMGTAGIARGQTIPGMQLAENCELYAIAGRNREKTLAYQREFGFQNAYFDYAQLLEDPQVEAVYIPLPNELHFDWVLKALRAKKHVLCEKPLAPSPALVEKLFQTAAQNGVLLMEAYAYLHSPLIAAIKQELDSGAIGQILYLESEFITSDYDISNIRMRKETYGGSTYDLGCYCTSMALWLLGSQPEKVRAISEFSDRGIDTLTAAIARFPGNQKAVLTSGMVLATEKNHRIDRLQVHGTKGCLVTDAQFNQCGMLTYRVRTEDTERVETVDTPHNYALEIAQFGRCIEGLETPHVTKEFSLANIQFLKMILEKIGY